MTGSLRVSELRYSPASPDDAALGLLGFASFLLNGAVRVDGIAVRRSASGRLILSWPARTDAAGKRHPYIRPISDEARVALEEQVLAMVGLAREPRP